MSRMFIADEIMLHSNFGFARTASHNQRLLCMMHKVDGTLSNRLKLTHTSRSTVFIIVRVAIVVACLVGIWNSIQLIRVDHLVRQDTADALRSAIHLAPDDSAALVRLAQLDDSQAQQLLEQALHLNPYNAQAEIELGLRYEANGDTTRAEKAFLQAFSVDHTYVTRWSLANFYLRQGNMPAFWMWARKAAEMPADNMGALFQLCWRVSPDPDKIAAALLNGRPSVIRQYLIFLIGKEQFHATISVASHLIREGDSSTNRSLLLLLVNKLLAANDVDGATAVWNDLLQNNWIIADTTVPNNASFAREPLPVGFDWSMPSYPGLQSWPGPSGLKVELAGSEPERCTIAEQTIALAPGNYILEYAFRTADIAPGTGIHWQIIDPQTNKVLAQSDDLSSNALRQSSFAFTVGSDTPLLRLRLAYKRALGTTRISGTLDVTHAQIHTQT